MVLRMNLSCLSANSLIILACLSLALLFRAAASSLSSALFVPGAVTVGGDCIVVGEPVPVGEAVVHASGECDAVVVESCDCGPSAGLKTGTFP